MKGKQEVSHLHHTAGGKRVHGSAFRDTHCLTFRGCCPRQASRLLLQPVAIFRDMSRQAVPLTRIVPRLCPRILPWDLRRQTPRQCARQTPPAATSAATPAARPAISPAGLPTTRPRGFCRGNTRDTPRRQVPR